MKKNILEGISDADKKEIVKRIIHLRKNHFSLTQPQLAERVGYSQTYISLLESGERDLTNEFLAAFLDAFQVSHDWLLKGTGAPVAMDSDVTQQDIQPLLAVLSKTCSLSANDEAFLSWYLSLDPSDRKKVLQLKEAVLSFPRTQ